MSNLLYEIIDEKSILGNKYIFHHFSLKEYYQNEAKFDEFLHQAISRGIKSEKDLLEEASQYGEWSEKDQNTLDQLSKSIQTYTEKRDKQKDIITRNQFSARIQQLIDQREDYIKRYKKITELSAETFANQRQTISMIESYVTDLHNTPISSEDKEFALIIGLFYEKINKLTDIKVLANTAYNENFFDLFYIHERDPGSIFQKSGFHLTVFQKNLIYFAKVIYNKLKNSLDMPEETKKDGWAILQYKDKKEEKQEKRAKTKQDFI